MKGGISALCCTSLLIAALAVSAPPTVSAQNACAGKPEPPPCLLWFELFGACLLAHFDDGSPCEDEEGKAGTCQAAQCIVDEEDSDGDGVPDSEDGCPLDPTRTVPGPNDLTCDGQDDDCDGSIDEDYASTPTQCGVGACQASGALVCSGGSTQNTCQPGSPSAEVCDGIDNDCDGTVDELCNPGGQMVHGKGPDGQGPPGILNMPGKGPDGDGPPGRGGKKGK